MSKISNQSAWTIKKGFEMSPFQKNIVNKVKEYLEECATDKTRIMFAKKEELHEYDGRKFSARDYGNEAEDNYIWVCFNGYMDGGDMQEMSWSDEEICFKDFMNGQYAVPEVFYDFDAIAVKNLAWHINGDDIFCTSQEEPGGIDTDMYYFV
ncbi:hypothetical protein ACE38V_22570 [Cytobacillus sp. Hz8]|uniref:hypothetical protein n=1 Tax=Cytobacillus sp. Hz8 TaxID=3347168 RepID=UPI0035D6792F